MKSSSYVIIISQWVGLVWLGGRGGRGFRRFFNFLLRFNLTRDLSRSVPMVIRSPLRPYLICFIQLWEFLYVLNCLLDCLLNRRLPIGLPTWSCPLRGAHGSWAGPSSFEMLLGNQGGGWRQIASLSPKPPQRDVKL